MFVTGGVFAATPEAGAVTVDADGLLVLRDLVDAYTHSGAQLCRDALPTDRREPWLFGALAAAAGFDAEAAGVAARLERSTPCVTGSRRSSTTPRSSPGEAACCGISRSPPEASGTARPGTWIQAPRYAAQALRTPAFRGVEDVPNR